MDLRTESEETDGKNRADVDKSGKRQKGADQHELLNVLFCTSHIHIEYEHV